MFVRYTQHKQHSLLSVASKLNGVCGGAPTDDATAAIAGLGDEAYIPLPADLVGEETGVSPGGCSVQTQNDYHINKQRT